VDEQLFGFLGIKNPHGEKRDADSMLLRFVEIWHAQFGRPLVKSFL